MRNAPVKKFLIGILSANVWKNDGTEPPFYTVDLQRAYKDDNGDLKNTTSLNTVDLLNAAHLLKLANAYIMEQ